MLFNSTSLQFLRFLWFAMFIVNRVVSFTNVEGTNAFMADHRICINAFRVDSAAGL